MLKMKLLVVLASVLMLAGLSGCSDDDTGEANTSNSSGVTDTGGGDVEGQDSGAEDAEQGDDTGADSGAQDSGDSDTGEQDFDAHDSSDADTGAQDLDASDADTQDATQQDADAQDTGTADTGDTSTDIDLGQNCTPGETKQVDCNTCTCTQQGDWACTKMACDDVYNPCENKTCGDTCTICDPNDPNCVETGVVKYCDHEGRCRATTPTCSM